MLWNLYIGFIGGLEKSSYEVRVLTYDDVTIFEF